MKLSGKGALALLAALAVSAEEGASASGGSESIMVCNAFAKFCYALHTSYSAANTNIHNISFVSYVYTHSYSYSFSLLHRLLLVKKAGCNPLAKTCQWRRRNSSQWQREVKWEWETMMRMRYETYYYYYSIICDFLSTTYILFFAMSYDIISKITSSHSHDSPSYYFLQILVMVMVSNNRTIHHTYRHIVLLLLLVVCNKSKTRREGHRGRL